LESSIQAIATEGQEASLVTDYIMKVTSEKFVNYIIMKRAINTKIVYFSSFMILSSINFADFGIGCLRRYLGRE
jgi:hypothetical protein